jgi:hypothetical protein
VRSSYAIALTLLRRALSMNEEIHGVADTSSVPMLMGLGKVFVAMGDCTQAEVYFVKVRLFFIIDKSFFLLLFHEKKRG